MSATNGVSCSQFFHRVNTNTTVDAICLTCFLTAATAGDEADLNELELAHRCEGAPAEISGQAVTQTKSARDHG